MDRQVRRHWADHAATVLPRQPVAQGRRGQGEHAGPGPPRDRVVLTSRHRVPHRDVVQPCGACTPLTWYRPTGAGEFAGHGRRYFAPPSAARAPPRRVGGRWALWVCGMIALLALPATAALLALPATAALLALPATAALPRRKTAPTDDERPVVASTAYPG
jgi:hypothetical protein